MHDWEIYFSPPSLKAYLVYQIAQAALCFEADFHEGIEFNMVHFDANGCIFDMCQHKNDIKIGMIAGSICPVCRSTLQRYGVREEAIVAIEHILQYVRSEAIGKPIIMDYNRAFIVMRFSSHDENDNAYLYGIKTALEELGIEPYRADNKVLSAQLLDQIKAEIMKSRFVIAKIDSENLNVFLNLASPWEKKRMYY